MHDRRGGARTAPLRVSPSLSRKTTAVGRPFRPLITGLVVYARADVFSHCCSAVAHFEAHRSLSSSSSSLCFSLQRTPTKGS